MKESFAAEGRWARKGVCVRDEHGRRGTLMENAYLAAGGFMTAFVRWDDGDGCRRNIEGLEEGDDA